MNKEQIGRISKSEYEKISGYMKQVGFLFEYEYVCTNRALNYVYTYVFCERLYNGGKMDRSEMFKRLTPCDRNDRLAIKSFITIRNSKIGIICIPESNLNIEQQ